MAKPIVITLKQPKTGREASRSRSPPPVMDLPALEGHVMKFQEGLNAWIEKETEKLRKLQEHGQELQGLLASKREEVAEFLAKHRSVEEDMSLAKLVPILIDMLEEDKRAFAALSTSLQDVAKRRGVPLEKKQPLDLLKALLRPEEAKSDDESYSYSD